MPESDYNINIRTTATGDGAKQTVTGLQDVTTAAKGTVPAQEAATEAATKHTHSHRELHVAAHALVDKFPHLTAVLWAFRSPLVAGGLAIGLFIEWCQRLREEWKKLEDSSGDISAKLTAFEGALKNPVERVRDAARATRDLKEAIDAVNKALLDPAKKTGEAEKAIDKQLEREKELLKVRKELVNAEIDLRLARKEISEAEGAKLKGQAGLFFNAEEARVTEAAAKAKQDLEAKAHLAAQQDFKGALDAHADAVQRVADAKDRLAGFEKAAKPLGELRAGRDAKLAEAETKAQSELSEAQRVLASNRGLPLEGIREKNVEEAQDRLDRIRTERREIQSAAEREAQKRKDLGLGVSTAEAFEKETISAVAGAKTRAETTRAAFVETGRESTAAAGQRAIIAPIQDQTESLKAQTEALKENAKLQEEMVRKLNEANRRIEQMLRREN
jgi:hypothetical protein